MTYRTGTKGRLVLRVDREGRVAAMNDAARHVLGGYGLGKACDEVVGGKAADGGTHCRPGCARELAAGALSENGVCRVILGQPVGFARRLECLRVGSEVHVLIE